MMKYNLGKFGFRMDDDWGNGYLIDLMEFQRGFDLPESDRVMGTYPVIASTGLVGYHNNYKVKAPGLVIGRSGSLGGGQFLKDNFWPLNTTLWVKDFKGNNQRYCYYYIKNIDLTLYNSGCGVPTLNRNHIHKINLLLLKNLKIQKKIAGVLAAFDELIEVNRRKIKILEEMAQAVYNEWFVKMRFPGHEKYAPPIGNGDGTAPYRVFDTPLGPIPEAWEVNKIIDFGVVVTGKTPPKNNYEYYGDYMPFIKIPDMHSNIFCVSTVESLSMVGVKYQQKKQLPPNSICVSCIGTPGIVCITSTISQTNQQINALILNKMIYREYLYFSLRDLKPIIELYGLNGATMVNLNKSKFENLFIKKPADELILAYQKNIVHFFDDIMNLQYKNHALSSLRDLLLPKLISGKIDVSELDIDEYALGDC